MKGSWHGSLRVRHTLMFGLMFLLAGSVVLGGVLILVQNSMDYSLAVVFARKLDKYDPTAEAWIAQVVSEDEVSRQIILDSMRDNLLFKGGLTLLAVCLVATAGAWWLSGRLLRPLNMITETAHRIAGRTLHKRIELDGPPSEVKSLADSFDSMLDRLDEAFAGQGRFIANAAHELKTPIALNRTLLDVAMARPDSSPQVLRLGENLLAVNVRHERLIDSLLTLARAEDAVTDRRPVDLAQLAEYALDVTAKAAVEQRVQVQSKLVASPVVGDPVLLEQLIRNLVDNAVRYNHPHGSVWVQTLAEDRQAEVIVTNTGALISPHEVPVLFEPFRRLTDRVGSARGSGLGLSIVRAVAQAHGGDALAIPRPDGGLSVRVILPRGDAPRS
ncbi:sensor histidine kinase [Catellatospora chokoriensis]|uniref:histidine kinase n=1 Tax=Catellatospora chokoriensis TaxID=310353 RepID=A0A8J3JNA1_9ACTN|nr:HAMP domain-containing sensor histidine kinase [Catellatospora chokoriensis]GIF88022.1 sensor protein CutS [Catellatospora chokoriensis]